MLCTKDFRGCSNSVTAAIYWFCWRLRRLGIDQSKPFGFLLAQQKWLRTLVRLSEFLRKHNKRKPWCSLNKQSLNWRLSSFPHSGFWGTQVCTELWDTKQLGRKADDVLEGILDHRSLFLSSPKLSTSSLHTCFLSPYPGSPARNQGHPIPFLPPFIHVPPTTEFCQFCFPIISPISRLSHHHPPGSWQRPLIHSILCSPVQAICPAQRYSHMGSILEESPRSVHTLILWVGRVRGGLLSKF